MLCKECGEPIPTSQQEEHFEEYHAKEKCDCGQLVEKMNLDEHKEKECPNRDVECEYCELTLPFNKMSSHVEYCGSRTQKCDACDRFIQMKDFTEHENTGCQYPIKEDSKKLPQSKPRNDFGLPVDMFHAMGEMDSPDAEYFYPLLAGMREFGQILNTGLGTPPFGDAHMKYPAGGAAFYSGVDNGMIGKSDVISRGARKGRASSKPEVDRRNLQDFDKASDEYELDVDDDEMLAAAYQADEFEDANGDTEWMSSAMVDEPLPYMKSTSLSDSENVLDKTQLPCEFCGDLFPVDTLILHQSGCQLRSLDSLPGHAPHFPDNRRTRHNLPQHSNSASSGDREIQNNHTEYDTKERKRSEDDTFLPCEFCQELIPFDTLIMHQAVCDAGPVSGAPSALFDGSTPVPPLNNSRPVGRIGSKSRPSRPVYESKKTPKSLEDFIPGDLDSRELTPDDSSTEFTRVDDNLPTRDLSHKPERFSDRYGGRDSSPMNNELQRPERKTSDPRYMRGQPILRNNDLDNKPTKDLPRVKNRTVDGKLTKRQPESRNEASTSYKASAAKIREDGLSQRKTNPGARSNPTSELSRPVRGRQSDSTTQTKPRQPSINDYTERSRRDVEHKMTMQNHRSEARASRPRHTDTSSSVARVSASHSSRTKATGSLPPVVPVSKPSVSLNGSSRLSVPSNPRRNPPTAHLLEHEVRPNRGKSRPQGHLESVRPTNTQASTPPKKTSSTRKKIV